MEVERQLRSRASLFNALVLFINKTERIVDTYWVDYDGLFKKIVTLKPGDMRSTNTFSTHPWVFKDSTTGETMHVYNCPVYWPKPFIVVDHQRHHRVKRKLIKIHFPMRSLKINSLWALAINLKNFKDIKDLELPKSLKIELLIVYKEYEKYKINQS